MLKNVARIHESAEAYVETRARMGRPPLSVQNIVYVRAGEIVAERMRRVDLLTGRGVAAAARSTKAEVRRVERQLQFEQLVKVVVRQVHRNSVQLARRGRRESGARAHREKQRAPIESLMVKLAMRAVVERGPTNSLTVEDALETARAARILIGQSFRVCGDAV
jgi:hypothetical protein